MRLTFLQCLVAPLRAAVAVHGRLTRAALAHWQRQATNGASPDATGAAMAPAPAPIIELTLPRQDAQPMRLRVPRVAMVPFAPLSLSQIQSRWCWRADTALPPASDGRSASGPMTLSGRLQSPRDRRRHAGDADFDVAVCLRRTAPTEGMLRLQQLMARTPGKAPTPVVVP